MASTKKVNNTRREEISKASKNQWVSAIFYRWKCLINVLEGACGYLWRMKSSIMARLLVLLMTLTLNLLLFFRTSKNTFTRVVMVANVNSFLQKLTLFCSMVPTYAWWFQVMTSQPQKPSTNDNLPDVIIQITKFIHSFIISSFLCKKFIKILQFHLCNNSKYK